MQPKDALEQNATRTPPSNTPSMPTTRGRSSSCASAVDQAGGGQQPDPSMDVDLTNNVINVAGDNTIKPRPNPYETVSDKKREKNMVGVGAQGGCSLWVLIVGASSIWKTPPTCSGWEKVYIRHGPAFKLPDFSLQASSIVRSTASCTTTFRSRPAPPAPTSL